MSMLSELPTSTFLLYFVCFLKGNTAVRFFLQKYVVLNFDFFCLFFVVVFFVFCFCFLNTGE